MILDFALATTCHDLAPQTGQLDSYYVFSMVYFISEFENSPINNASEEAGVELNFPKLAPTFAVTFTS